MLTAYNLADKHRMLNRAEVDLLQKCARMLPPNPFIINIGANVGTGSVAMLEARPDDAYIISIDKKPCPMEIDNIVLAGLDPRRCIRILTTSQKAGHFFPVLVDMVFVDGDHSEKGIMGDILAWKPKLKDGGIMVFHDFMHPNLPKYSPIVDSMMAGSEVIGEARYMIAFRVWHGNKSSTN